MQCIICMYCPGHLYLKLLGLPTPRYYYIPVPLHTCTLAACIILKKCNTVQGAEWRHLKFLYKCDCQVPEAFTFLNQQKIEDWEIWWKGSMKAHKRKKACQNNTTTGREVDHKNKIFSWARSTHCRTKLSYLILWYFVPQLSSLGQSAPSISQHVYNSTYRLSCWLWCIRL